MGASLNFLRALSLVPLGLWIDASVYRSLPSMLSSSFALFFPLFTSDGVHSVILSYYLIQRYVWCGNLRERDHSRDPGVDGRIILRWIFRKWKELWGLDGVGSG